MTLTCPFVDRQIRQGAIVESHPQKPVVDQCTSLSMTTPAALTYRMNEAGLPKIVIVGGS